MNAQKSEYERMKVCLMNAQKLGERTKIWWTHEIMEMNAGNVPEHFASGAVWS